LITNKKKFFIEILKGILKLIVAGIFIGYLKEYAFWIAVILAAKIFHNIYKDIVKPTAKNWLLLIGMLLTCFGGIVGETWGVS
jgi:hypothetical protein